MDEGYPIGIWASRGSDKPNHGPHIGKSQSSNGGSLVALADVQRKENSRTSSKHLLHLSIYWSE